MRDIERVLSSYLTPLYDEIAALNEAMDQLDRRLRNQCRIGLIESLDTEKSRVKVRHGELLTPWIPWAATAAGQIKTFRAPSIGEQCLLLNFAGGESGSQTIAICGIFYDQFQAPAQKEHIHRTVYPDGTSVSYDFQSHHLDVLIAKGTTKAEVTKSIHFETPKITISGDVSIDGHLYVQQAIKSDSDITDKSSSMQSMRDQHGAHKHKVGNPFTSPPTEKMT